MEGNPRKIIKPEGLRILTGLIREHGFQNPLQVYREGPKGYTILCGNHRFKAGQAMGMSSFPCIEYKRTHKEAMARAVSDNKSAEITDWDIPLLKDLLTDLDDGDFDMELTGFTDDDLEDLFAEDPPPKARGSLKDKFLIPPFSVFNAREKWWRDRKKFWQDMGIESELGRAGTVTGGGVMLAATQKGNKKTVRGDGRGRAIKK